MNQQCCSKSSSVRNKAPNCSKFRNLGGIFYLVITKSQLHLQPNQQILSVLLLKSLFKYVHVYQLHSLLCMWTNIYSILTFSLTFYHFLILSLLSRHLRKLQWLSASWIKSKYQTTQSWVVWPSTAWPEPIVSHVFPLASSLLSTPGLF